MSALLDILNRQISQSGPISVADFMATVLMHPEHGYYVTRDPFGVQGDFTTAPEISQMFGELIGLSLAQAWLDQGAPNPCILAELGPGRGTLMADILRATRTVPQFHAALSVHFIEASASLKERQAKAVTDATWHDSTESLPDGPLFLVANEFFDALPIRQFIRKGDGWSERVIGSNDGALTWGVAPPLPVMMLEHRIQDTKDRDMVEICTAGQSIATDISRRVAHHGGAALIIDYGDWRSLGDTLQALHKHKAVDPLDQIGNADITAHVDFEMLADAISDGGSKFTRVTSQGVFLERLGITQRAQTLSKNLTGDAFDAIVDAHRRLTHPTEMGTLFKVLGIYPNTAQPPAGLEP